VLSIFDYIVYVCTEINERLKHKMTEKEYHEALKLCCKSTQVKVFYLKNFI